MCLWYFRQYVGRHRLYKLCTAITRCFHKKRSPADVRLYRIVQRSEEMCREDVNINEVVYLVNSSFIAHTSQDRKSTRLNSSHVAISYAVFCLKKKTHIITA